MCEEDVQSYVCERTCNVMCEEGVRRYVCGVVQRYV